MYFLEIGESIPYNKDFTIKCKLNLPDINDDYVLLLPFNSINLDDYYNKAYAYPKNFDGCVLKYDFKCMYFLKLLMIISLNR